MTEEAEKPAEAYMICLYAAKYSGVALAGVRLLEFQNGSIDGRLEAGQNGGMILQYRAPWGTGAERLQGLVLCAGEHVIVEIMISREKRSVFVNQNKLRGDSSDQLVPANMKQGDAKPGGSWIPLANHAKIDNSLLWSAVIFKRLQLSNWLSVRLTKRRSLMRSPA